MGLAFGQVQSISSQVVAIFNSGIQGAWFAPNQATATPWFQDSAATTPVTAFEQFIGNARDRSGGGNHATQATAANRPIYRQDAQGFSYTESDGVNDSLSSAAGGGGTAGFFYCAAVQLNAGGAIQSLFSDAGLNGGYRARVLAGNQVELASGGGTPLTPPVADAASMAAIGGTLPAATYFTVITALNAKGESLKSNEVSVATLGTTSTITNTWAAVAGATSYRIYRGTATGAQDVFNAVGNVLTFTDTGAAATAGAPPTTTDTAFTKLTSAALTLNSVAIVSVFDDGTNLNIQMGVSAPVTIPRVAVSAGSAGISYRKSNVAALEFGNVRVFEEIYFKGTSGAADQRLKAQRQVAASVGVTL